MQGLTKTMRQLQRDNINSMLEQGENTFVSQLSWLIYVPRYYVLQGETAAMLSGTACCM